MFSLTVTAPPAVPPLTAAQLRERLRLNDDAEDSLLAEFIGQAAELFETDTGRPVISTGYRQDLDRWPAGLPIVLGRGGVTSVAAVTAYQADGSEEPLDDAAWRANLSTPPACVYLAEAPALVTTDAGLPVRPVGAVRFVAGWPTPADVPPLVRSAIALLAGHYYQHREAYLAGADLRALPEGWSRVTAAYRLGLSGSWGQ